MGVRAIRHAGIVVSDADRSLAFYRDLLGLRVVSDQLEQGKFIESLLCIPGIVVRTIKLAAAEGVTLLELLHIAETAAPADVSNLSRLGPTHAALTVEDLMSLHDHLSEAGVDFRSPPLISADGAALVAFCSDPDGVPIELVEPLS